MKNDIDEEKKVEETAERRRRCAVTCTAIETTTSLLLFHIFQYPCFYIMQRRQMVLVAKSRSRLYGYVENLRHGGKIERNEITRTK